MEKEIAMGESNGMGKMSKKQLTAYEVEALQREAKDNQILKEFMEARDLYEPGFSEIEFKKPTKLDPWREQIGGNHYKVLAIQPTEFCEANGFGHLQSCITKRISRYNLPGGNGLEDLQKIKHEVDLLIDIELQWRGFKRPIDNIKGVLPDELPPGHDIDD
jgi:hypothetical protein